MAQDIIGHSPTKGVLNDARGDNCKDLVSKGAGDAEANMPLARVGQCIGLVPYHISLNDQSCGVYFMVLK